MPSKLENYIESLRHDWSKNIKLPSIRQKYHKTDKKPIKSKPVQTSTNRSSQNQTELSYSKPKHLQQALIALKSKSKRTMTEYVPGDFNNLSKLEQKIMMEIKNIDVCLESQRNESKQKNQQKKSMFGGTIFLNQVNDFVVEKFHQYLALQSQASYSITDGFQVSQYFTDMKGQVTAVGGKIINSVPSMSNKLLAKSIQAIQEFDERTNHEYIKNYGLQWSLHKRDISQINPNQQQLLEKQLLSRNYSIRQNNNSLINSNLSFSKVFSPVKGSSQSVSKSSDSKSTNLFDSKISALTKNSKISQLISLDLFNTKNTKQVKNIFTVKTEPTNVTEDKNLSVVVKLTKKEVLMMLKKSKNIISMWIPPSSYPQFFGIFSYKLIKSQTSIKGSFPNSVHKCKLTKYFFNKFGLNTKIFDSIIEYLSFENNLMIESLEISVQKTVFNRLFSKMGWIMKSWESSTKIKASYFLQNKKQKQ